MVAVESSLCKRCTRVSLRRVLQSTDKIVGSGEIKVNRVDFGFCDLLWKSRDGVRDAFTETALIFSIDEKRPCAGMIGDGG
jgi:hypothetical protein